MSTWNYRILKYKSGEVGIHEAYYDEEGKVNGWTKDPLIVGDTVKELFKILKMIEKDMIRFPDIIDYEE